MLRIVISTLNVKLKRWLPVVWFWAEDYDWQDFYKFVEYVKRFRQAQKEIIYDFDLRKNLVETNNPKLMIDELKKLFDSKKWDYDDLIVDAYYEKFVPPKEKDFWEQIELDITEIKKEFEPLYWTFINEKYQLREHQYEAVEFFKQKRRIYLAYEPWTWKSLSYYSSIIYDNYYNWTKNILVLSPAKYNAHVNLYEEFNSYFWERDVNLEFYQWWAKERQRILDEFEENKNKPWINIIIISYETLRLKATIEKFEELAFDLIICDEAKALINWSSKQSTAVREIIENNPGCWIIMWEWTPMRWFADDLWNPLDILQPNDWWSYWTFRSRYCFTKTVNFWNTSTVMVTWVKNTWELHKRVKNVMLTKKLNELKDIPPVQFTRISVWLTPKHKKLLWKIQEDFIEWYREFTHSNRKASMLERDEEQMKRMQVLRLYQASTVPTRLDESFDEKDIEWLRILAEYVDEVILQRWKKVVIFTHFRESAFMIERAIKELKVFKKENYSLVNYILNDKLEMKNKFQEDENCKVFISTVSSWWEAITLTSADSVIFYELPMTWSAQFQAIRRVQRIWQEAKKINVISIIPEWTILEWIEKRLDKKRASLEKIIDWKEDFKDEDFVDWMDDILKSISMY